MNYLQNKYNYNDDEYQTTIKVKYPTDRTVYDMTVNINRNIVNESSKEKVLRKYQLKLEDNKKDYTINTGNFEFVVKSDKKGLGALNKTNKSSRYVSIDNLPEVDLSTTEYRQRLLSGKGLTKDENKFLEYL
jgi:hypothetical protein